MSQLSLDFHPGLTAQFRSLAEVCSAAVYASKGGVGGIAAALDLAPSDLQRRLNPTDDGRPLTVDQADGIIGATKDYRPIYWLVEKYLQDPEAKRLQAIEALAKLVPVMQALIEQSAPEKVRSLR